MARPTGAVPSIVKTLVELVVGFPAAPLWVARTEYVPSANEAAATDQLAPDRVAVSDCTVVAPWVMAIVRVGLSPNAFPAPPVRVGVRFVSSAPSAGEDTVT